MTNNWSPFTLNLPGDISDVGDLVTDLISTLNDFLTIVKTALELAKALASFAATNPVEAALKILIDQIEAILDGLTKATAAHAIFIPIQKPFLGINTTLALDVTTGDINATFNNLESNGAFADNTTIDSEIVTFINTSKNARGGNKGFWNTLNTSVRDENDFNRPQFTNDFAVTGLCIVFGAETMGGLQSIFDFLQTLLKLGSRSTLDRNSRPVIQNLKARSVPLTDATPARIAIQLDWDSVPPLNNFSIFGSDEVTVNSEILIIRSISPQTREKTQWSQLFSTQPTNIDFPETAQTKVIARLQNDGFIKRYIDEDASLEEGKVYYYSAAIRYTMNGETQPISPLSNVIRVQFTRPIETKKGEPPDWHATPSLIKLFPAIEGFVNEIKLILATITSRTISDSGILAMIEQTISQIDQLVQDGEDVVDTLGQLADDLRALENASDLGMYTTTFSVNSGGMNSWLGELANRLRAPSDVSRPPFDAEELVAGFVLVAGAPNLSGLTDFIALLELLFGSQDKERQLLDSQGNATITIPGPRNPLIEAIDAVDALLPEPDETVPVFDNNMSSSRELPTDPETRTESLFDNNMNPTETNAATVVCK